MKRSTLALVLGVGIVGSQAGHLLAYQLRFGSAALQVQNAGAHAYFPTLAKNALGLAAAAALAALFLIALARVAGTRPEKESAPPYVRLLAALFTIQLVCFGLQETGEASLTGAAPTSVAVLLLWGTVGQLPIAAVAALALRWLLARLRPALAQLSLGYTSAFQVLPQASTFVPRPTGTEQVASTDGLAVAFNRRGPPSFLRSALH